MLMRNHREIQNPGRGGKRKGAGRKPDAFKEECSRLCSSDQFFKWAKRVIDGDCIVPRTLKDDVIHTEANVTEMVYLWEKLSAYGYGKPMQGIEMTGANGGPLEIKMVVYAKDNHPS